MSDERVDAYMASLDGWRKETAAGLRQLIRDAAPALDETWKWGTPVYAGRVNVCAIGVFKDHVKVNFFKGASVPDPSGLFNAGLDAKTMRSIDFREGDVERLDERAFAQLVRAAVAADAK